MQETKDYDDFKVGDTVYCALRGQGKVIKWHKYPVVVRFDTVAKGEYPCYGYTNDGKPYGHNKRTLFFTPPELKPGSVKRPYESKLIGKEVFVTMNAYTTYTFCGTVVYEDATCIKIKPDLDQADHLIFEKNKIRRIREVGKDVDFQ